MCFILSFVAVQFDDRLQYTIRYQSIFHSTLGILLKVARRILKIIIIFLIGKNSVLDVSIYERLIIEDDRRGMRFIFLMRFFFNKKICYRHEFLSRIISCRLLNSIYSKLLSFMIFTQNIFIHNGL